MSEPLNILRAAMLTALVSGVLAPASAQAIEQDPTLPAQMEASATAAGPADAAANAGPQLQAIICASGKCRANISGKTFRVGDELGGSKIESIDRHEVVLSQNGEKKSLRLVAPLLRQDKAQ